MMLPFPDWDEAAFPLDPILAAELSKKRCKSYRRRILEISQMVGALHVGGAFSSVEIVDAIHELMGRDDRFILSKGHAAILLYVVLEGRGILTSEELNRYCTSQGCLGVHATRGTAGIDVSTGSLGHGLAIGIGRALADKSRTVFVLMSDGELQEGSTWESILQAPALRANNMTVFVDNNDFQSLGRASRTHPNLYPIADKFRAFGWNAVDVDGHNPMALRCATLKPHDGPLAVICRTVKGRGVSFMENKAVWHFRSPDAHEFERAMDELK